MTFSRSGKAETGVQIRADMSRNTTYEQLTDEELIRRLRSGDGDVEEYLLEKYKRMVRTVARSYFLTGGSQEDLIQEGMLGLFRAIRTYDPEKGSPFAVYARLLTERQIYTAIGASNTLKQKTLNTSVSIDAISEEGQDAVSRAWDNPETLLLDRENAEDLRKKIFRRLSPMEKRVLEDYLNGYDYVEIAARMGRTPKSVDNALQRIRSKAADLRRSIYGK